MSYKRVLLKFVIVIFGTAIAAFGLDMAIYAGFGSATLAVLWQGIAKTIHITVGQASLVVATVMVIFCWFYDRKQINVGTVLYQLIYSFCLDLFSPLMRYGGSKLLNFVIMVVGLVIFSFGSALYSVADFGKGSYEALTFAFVDRKKWPISNVRVVLDVVCVMSGWLLGGTVGICTVATILLSGILLQWFVKLLTPTAEKILK